jgi:hypothetical protein
MSSRTNLRRALSAMDDASTALRRALQSAEGSSATYIRRAISEIEEAESKVKRAVRELPAD